MYRESAQASFGRRAMAATHSQKEIGRKLPSANQPDSGLPKQNSDRYASWKSAGNQIDDATDLTPDGTVFRAGRASCKKNPFHRGTTKFFKCQALIPHG